MKPTYLVATPAFAESKIEIVGEGTTYQLEIKNKVSGSTYKWSRATPRWPGSAARSCYRGRQGYSRNQVCYYLSEQEHKTLTCKVTVIIPATKLKINNAVEVNGAHIMKIGDI